MDTINCNQDAHDDDHAFREPTRSEAARDPLIRDRPTSRGELVVPGPERYRVPYESRLEANWAYSFMARPDFARIESQPPTQPFIDAYGRDRSYTLDFRVTLKSGVRVGVEVKPHVRVTAELIDDISRLSAQIPSDFADRLVIVTDRQLTRHHIEWARLLHACRCDSPPSWDAVVASLIPTLRKPTTIADFVVTSGGGGNAFRAVVRAIGSGLLDVISLGRVHYPTWVVPGRNAGAVS